VVVVEQEVKMVEVEQVVLELVVHFQFVEQQHIQLQLEQAEEEVLLQVELMVLMETRQYFQLLHQQVEEVEEHVLQDRQEDQAEEVEQEVRELLIQEEQEILRQLVHHKEIQGEQVILE
jgi:hypothetical protein